MSPVSSSLQQVEDLAPAVARRRELAHAAALGVLQLALGIYFEVSRWQLAPVWYHLSFLVLLLPGSMVGGQLRVRVARRR